MRVAVVTLYSAARLDHARNQFRRVGEQITSIADRPADGADQPGDEATQSERGAVEHVDRVGVWLDASDAPELPAHEGPERVVRVPPGIHGLRLAAGRNAGAREALARGADLLVFLDADCLPGPTLLADYASAAALHPAAVLCGPVTYLPEGADLAEGSLRASTAPHSARPNLPAGESRAATADEYALFWSLSFAVTAAQWSRSGGFDEAYEGYGGEDTDFARRLRQSGDSPLRWVGGAHAYHQYHPTSSPPRQHLGDILRNAALFHTRWGDWPMTGWLEAFEREGLVVFEDGEWMPAPPAP